MEIWKYQERLWSYYLKNTRKPLENLKKATRKPFTFAVKIKDPKKTAYNGTL